MSHDTLKMSDLTTVALVVNMGLWVKPTGSRVTKSGWKDLSDYDYVVFDPEDKLSKQLVDRWGFGVGGSERPEQEFTSYKKGVLNFIVTSKADFFKKYCMATELIKTVDAKTREERIKLFDIIFGTPANLEALEF